MYCEPVNDLLKSDADHREALITPLTRFVFVCNGLEECYRFVSQIYEAKFDKEIENGKQSDYLRSRSMQAAHLMQLHSGTITTPTHYEHLVGNFRQVILRYLKEFPGKVDVPFSGNTGRDYGLALVRNVRNHVAHGTFPIVENPEYSDTDAQTKRNLINLMNQASRIAAINIQMLLAISAGPFDSELYDQHIDDDDYGEIFRRKCNTAYLLDLHLRQEFGLNEEDYFAMLTSREEGDEEGDGGETPHP